jgi:hypothetical protein
MSNSINTTLKDLTVRLGAISRSLQTTKPENVADELKKIQNVIDQILITNPELEKKIIINIAKLYDRVRMLESHVNNLINHQIINEFSLKRFENRF